MQKLSISYCCWMYTIQTILKYWNAHTRIKRMTLRWLSKCAYNDLTFDRIEQTFIITKIEQNQFLLGKK